MNTIGHGSKQTIFRPEGFQSIMSVDHIEVSEKSDDIENNDSAPNYVTIGVRDCHF